MFKSHRSIQFNDEASIHHYETDKKMKDKVRKVGEEKDKKKRKKSRSKEKTDCCCKLI